MSSHWKLRHNSAWWIGSFVAVMGLMSAVARGEPPSVDESLAVQDRLVMLTSGRILSGLVSRNGGGFLVEQPNGRVQVPLDDVQFVVDDLHEGYRKQRDSVVHPTPATHFALANWCLSHRLNDEARDELKKCLKVDPENEDARRLLQRVTDTIRAGLPPAATPPAPRKTSDGFLQPDVESLGGLSRDVATQFTSRIQPFLLNKCGNASCHGAASNNSFRLISARAGGNGSRQNSERNLAATMRYINLQDVEQSQLLAVFRKGHGGKGSILVGAAAGEQWKQLRAWAQSLAEEKMPTPRSHDDFPSVASRFKSKVGKRTVKTVFAEIPPSVDVTEEEIDEDTDLSDDPPSRPRALKPDRSDVHATPALKPFDPFDPELFNRRPRRLR